MIRKWHHTPSVNHKPPLFHCQPLVDIIIQYSDLPMTSPVSQVLVTDPHGPSRTLPQAEPLVLCPACRPPSPHHSQHRVTFLKCSDLCCCRMFCCCRCQHLIAPPVEYTAGCVQQTVINRPLRILMLESKNAAPEPRSNRGLFTRYNRQPLL